MVIYMHSKVNKDTDLFKKGTKRFGISVGTGEKYSSETGTLSECFKNKLK